MRCALLGMGVLLLATQVASAGVPADLDLRRELVDGRYLIRHWDLSDGLPQASITDMTQGGDGFLWLTTFGGLVRFDGHEFRALGGAPTSVGWNPRTTAAQTALDGGLWIGLQDGGVVRWQDGVFTDVAQPAGLRDATVWDIADGPGGLLVAADRGTWLHRDGEWRSLAPPADRGEATGLAVAWDSAGVGWIGCPGGLDRLDPDGIRRPFEPGRFADTAASLEVAEDGGLWVGGSGYLALVEGDDVWFHPSPELATSHLGDLVVSGDRELWAVGGSTVSMLGPADAVRGAMREERPPPAIQSWAVPGGIRCAFADRERNLWVGSDGRGLWRFTRQGFERYGPGVGLPAPSVRVMVGDGLDSLWVAGLCHGVVRLRDGKFEAPPPDLPAEGCCNALLIDAGGGFWIACGSELTRYAREGDTFEALESWDAGAPVDAVAEGADGTIWVGTSGGGALRIDGESVQVLGVEQGLGDPYVHAIAFAPDGAVWLGQRTGSSRFADGELTVLTEADGHPPGTVRTFLVDADGTIWIGTYGGGLARYRDGAFQRFTSRDGLFDDVVSQILDGEDGSLWMNGNRGVFRVRRDDLTAFAEGRSSRIRSRSFPTGEGNGGSQPAGWREDTGRMWFPTIDGVVGFGPGDARVNAVPPVLHVERARLDGTRLEPSREVEVPPGRGDLEVHYTAATLRRPELTHFEYRLLGRDDRWQSAGTRRVVRYTNLAPGRYTLELRAINEDDVASDVPARLSFVLAPHVHQTLWFQLLAGIALVAVGGGLGLTRARKIREHNRQLRDEVGSRRAAESALRDKEAHYRQIVEAATDGFLLADGRGRWLDANSAACRIFDLDRETLLGTPAEELFEEDVFALGTGPCSGEAPEIPVVRCRRGDGTTVEAQILAARFISAARQRILLTVTDISGLMRAEEEKRDLQRRLDASRRLEGLGRLAGGIAHDFNNTLTVVEGNADLLTLLLAPEPASQVEEAIGQIRDCSHRANAMIRQLLAFGRRQSLAPAVLDPGEVVHGLESMFRRLLRDDIELRIQVDEDTGCIHADLSQAEQALVNLLINAADAMPDGGTVTVSVAPVAPAEAAQDYPDVLLEGDHVRISVEDDGQGIPGEVRPRIFEPFFSTKPVGRGSGLGLASVHGFVTQSRGQLGVRSEEGQGARFDIFMPSVDGPPTVDPESQTSEDLPAGEESVLLCDDNPEVRAIVAGVLESHGYDVEQAPDGRTALQTLHENPGRFAALVTDVVMPEIDGSELAREARATQPDIRVLLITGYALDVDLEAPEGCHQTVLPKPFSAALLLETLRGLLDG